MFAPEHTSRPPHRGWRKRQGGLSIVELMVGIVIMMLVALAAVGSANSYYSAQRQSVGTGGTAVSINTVLASIKEDVASAGLGFFGTSGGSAAMLCPNLNYSRGATLISDGSAFSPLQVSRVSNLDQIDVAHATQVESGIAVPLQAATVSPSASAALASYLPAAVGQAVLLAPGGTGGTCTIRTVTAVTASTSTSPLTLTFDSTGASNSATFTSPQAYSTSGTASVLGDVQWRRYRINDGALLYEEPMLGTSVVLARNVIAMQAQYGVSATAGATDTSISSWVDPTGTWASLSATNIARVRAVRVGLILRSPSKEKKDAAGSCTATTGTLTLFSTSFTPTLSDWQCYRYRTSTVVIPMRNVVMGSRT